MLVGFWVARCCRAAVADGESNLTGIDYFERGRGVIASRLQGLGVDVEKV